MRLIAIATVMLIISMIHYSDKHATQYTNIPSRRLRETLARSLARSVTNDSGGPFATKQRLIYAVIKGRPSFSSFVCIRRVLQPVLLGLYNAVLIPLFPASSCCIFLFPACAFSPFLSLSLCLSVSLIVLSSCIRYPSRHPLSPVSHFYDANTRREIGDTCPSCSLSLSLSPELSRVAFREHTYEYDYRAFIRTTEARS